MVGLPSAKVTHLPKEAPPTYQTKLNRDGSCALRRRASTHRHPPPRRRLGRAARPAFRGGRQLTLYLKVAMCRASRRVPVDGRGGWTWERLVAPLSSGIACPVESAVKPPRRHTKARRGSQPNGPWHYYRRGVAVGGSIFR